MFTRLLISMITAMAAPAVAGTAEPFAPAVAELSVASSNDGAALDGHIWFPTHTSAARSALWESAVWQSPQAAMDAPLAEGQFPVLLISHGMYGNSRNQAWLASAMAAKGWIVAMPNHPGTTTFDRDPALSARLSTRPQDISRVLDHLAADANWAEALDLSRVAVAGHSLGGYTAMRLAGARHDPVRQRAYCNDLPERADCSALERLGAGIDSSGDAELSADRSDARIRAAISFDLGGTQLFSPASLAAINTPVLVIGAGRGDMLDQDVESRALAAFLPEDRVQFVEMAGAGHFDFLGICTEQGYAVLKEEIPEDAMVCEDGTDGRRERQAATLEHILTFLGQEGF